jgi:HAD superfamily hydrolase (TIGR01549 family)
LGIRAISFDFWNTLFTEQPGGFALYQANRRRLLRSTLSELGEFTDRQLDHACALEGESHYRVWCDEHRTLGALERLAEIIAHLGVSLPDLVTAEMATAFEEGVLEHPPVLIPGAAETLEQLSKQYRLGIISDVGFSPGRVLRQVLDGAGILGLFDSLVFSDEAGRSKPHAEVFARMARELEATPFEMVHVGDLERTDIIGAKEAGYYAIRFVGATPMYEDERTIADAVTADLLDLPKLVAAL